MPTVRCGRVEMCIPGIKSIFNGVRCLWADSVSLASSNPKGFLWLLLSTGFTDIFIFGVPEPQANLWNLKGLFTPWLEWRLVGVDSREQRRQERQKREGRKELRIGRLHIVG